MSCANSSRACHSASHACSYAPASWPDHHRASAYVKVRKPWLAGSGQRAAPVEVIVPGILAVLRKDGQQLGVLRDQFGVAARQRKPLAAFAPVPPQLVAHAHPKPPGVRPLSTQAPRSELSGSLFSSRILDDT